MMKITRRTVDPITFVERIGIEFIPRIEDSILDDQLAGFMSCKAAMNAPRIFRQHSPSPPPPPLHSPSQELRPPTPPKHRGTDNPNAPRNPSLSPALPRQILIGSPGVLASPGAMFLSPRTSAKRKTLSQIGENAQMSEGSLTDMDALQTSISRMATEEAKLVKCVRFSDEVELNEFVRMRNSVIAEIFWRSSELEEFRYEAFMEKAGLDIADFD